MPSEARLRHVVAEVQATNPAREVVFECSIAAPVRCDEKRIEQLLSNLLANAVEHGKPGASIVVSAHASDEAFWIRVSNQGDAIPPDTQAKLFQPYFRGGQSDVGSGLGLGLYIVSEIAKSHGGVLDVTSARGLTTFTFTMPRASRT